MSTLNAKYRKFHKTEPKRIRDARKWVPGELVLLGSGVDVGYGIVEPDSAKDGKYVHDFGSGVKVYRRARAGERPDVTWKNFPSKLMVLGDFLGATVDDGEERYEIKGSTRKKLTTNSAGRMLAVVGSKGVELVFKGGNMRVTDWIYD